MSSPYEPKPTPRPMPRPLPAQPYKDAPYNVGIRRNLALALLLACGACINTTDGGTPDSAWTQIGDGIYRIDDPERGVSCYWMSTNGRMSCAPSNIPPVTPEANDAQK